MNRLTFWEICALLLSIIDYGKPSEYDNLQIGPIGIYYLVPAPIFQKNIPDQM